MIVLLDQARRTIASNPLWLFLALLLLSTIVRRIVQRNGAVPLRTDAFARYTSVVVIGYYVGLALWYAMAPQQVDPAEPTMTCAAWLFRSGQPTYHAIDSAARYSHMYGPMAFAVPAVALWLFGPSMFVAKAVGVAAALLALGFMWLAIRSVTRDTWIAIIACGVCVLQFLMFRNQTFWSRPEPLQLLAMCLSLFAAARLRSIPAVVVVSLSLGLLWNLKFTGPLYSLPILGLLWTRTNTSTVALSVIGASIVAALPFVALSNVSWNEYLLWVRLSARNGLRVAALKENIEWALLLLIPIIARLSNPTPLPDVLRSMIPALIVGFLGIIVAASKPGAGAYHFIPFLPVIAYICAASVWPQQDTTVSERATTPGLRSTTYDPRSAWLSPFVATLLVIVLIQQQYFLRLATSGAVAASYGDVAAYLEQHPGERVGMGYTSAEAMTFARTLIVFKTGEYMLDVPAIQEHQLSGLPLPQATTDAMRQCSTRTWLLPRGDAPFRIRNDYPQTGHAEIFPPEFIDAFQQHYTLAGHTAHYDVWRCRAGGS